MTTFFKKKKLNNSGEPIPEDVKREVWERSHGRCEFCGKPAVDPHHIKYRSHGGFNIASNIIALCRACHENISILQKIAKDPLRYIGKYLW
jgi:5-methylcytosine-specific restriction endonuclease McrA